MNPTGLFRSSRRATAVWRVVSLLVATATLAVITPAAAAPGGDAALNALDRLLVATQNTDVAKKDVVAAQQALADAQDRLAAAGVATMVAAAALSKLSAQQASAGKALSEANAKAIDVTLGAYVHAGSDAEVQMLLTSDSPQEIENRRTLIGAVSQYQREVVERVEVAKRAVDDQTRKAVQAHEAAKLAERTELIATGAAGVALADAQDRLVAARASEDVARQALVASSVGIASSGVLAGTDLPLVALHAYELAAAWAQQSFGCDIQWWGLAGIGRHESNHGRYRDGNLRTDGLVWPAIIGIALDGNNNTQVIRDTDSGSMDGDTVFDRAVGPMQFIPSSWKSYAAKYDLDAHHRGLASPHDMYDAARAAAALLCNNSAGLTSEAGLRRAYWSYNHSQTYNDDVFSSAAEYSALTVPDLRALAVPSGGVTPPELAQSPSSQD